MPTPIKVLICEDNASMRAMLRAVMDLRPSLLTVGEAADGDEAVREAQRLQPDVILLDLSMPRRTGLSALPELCRVASAARIIVLSGFSSNSVSDDVIALGAVLYLSKGADPDAIIAAIEHAAEARADVPARSAIPS